MLKLILRFKTLLNKITHFIFAVAQQGLNVLCLLCGWQGRKFMLPAKRCPRCSSLPRNRLIPYALLHFNIDLNNKSILHMGPNMAEVAYIFNHFMPASYHRIDLCKKNIINLPGDICKIPINDFSTDIIIAWHVLEHVNDDYAAIREMWRILRRGGLALISVPISPPNRLHTDERKNLRQDQYKIAYGHPDHCRACGLDYFKRFEDVGFKITTLEIKCEKNENINLFGLSQNHIVWCATK